MWDKRTLTTLFATTSNFAGDDSSNPSGAECGEVGVPGDEIRLMLTGDAYETAVAADVREARRYGANGVPFFVLGRTYGLSGAQPADTFLSALRTSRAGAAGAARR